MNHFHRIYSQEGFFHQTCQPMGRCHNAELSYLRKKRFLQFIIFLAPIKETGRGIGRFLRAVMAASFPFVTMNIVKISAMSGESPAVMA